MIYRFSAMLFAATILLGCDYVPASLGGYTYRAEVGYYDNGIQVWYVGLDKTYDDCMSEAIGRFNAINYRDPARAFSWACRKMQGERFLSRVR